MNDAVITRRERDADRCNHRGMQPGIYGNCIDSATGKELDRQAWVFGVRRNGARLFGWLLPWRQSDEALRKRVFLAYRRKAAPGPCIHNVWCGYGDGTKCGDCGEWRGRGDVSGLLVTACVVVVVGVVGLIGAARERKARREQG